MSLHEDITTEMHRIVDRWSGDIAAADLAAAAMAKFFDVAKFEEHAEYLCWDAAKRMARNLLAGRFDPANEDDDTQGELFSGELQTLIDKLGKDDQMDMVYIQTLSDRLNEQFGFASSYASKYHDTLMAIIGNMA